MQGPASNHVFADPLFQSLLSGYEKAADSHRQALIDLRAYHFVNPPASADPWRAAVLAQAAEDTHRRLEDALHALNEYAWQLTPHSSSPAHLAAIEAQRWFHKQRLAGMGWGPGARLPEGPEAKVGEFTVVLKEGITLDGRESGSDSTTSP